MSRTEEKTQDQQQQEVPVDDKEKVGESITKE